MSSDSKFKIDHMLIHAAVCTQDNLTQVYLPLLDQQLKPEHLLLFYYKEDSLDVDSLVALAASAGIECSRFTFGSRELDQQAVKQTLLHYSEQADIIVNATASGALSHLVTRIATKLDLPIITVDRLRDRVIGLNRIEVDLDLENHLTIESHFALHGYRATANRGVFEHDGQSGKFLLNHSGFDRALRLLNGLSVRAEHQPGLRVNLDRQQMDNARLMELIRFHQNRKRLTLSGRTIQFKDEIARFHVAGGWLESFVYEQLTDLKLSGTIQDLAHSVVIESKETGKFNELDVVLLIENQLIVIECKTSNLTGAQGASNTLYKLDAVRDLGGACSKALLATHKPLRKGDLRRAQDLDIEVMSGSALLGINKLLNSE